ncbi:Oxidoreductase, NAD-binding site [Sulfitobacter noctilucicola]|uniref:Glycine/D-amino acid oxidase-like deaminating enzyme n=2 Tax=Sulfitobacter noctilucicola TaxID=1342301 RepID=A0A7W6M8F3_9RHOB|nr:Oxidoreductase, NAD-binding site [Sulfitobacter noctilucicola]MBB4174379.1 glycine/D-amino acid oxidase-like deaminating enzyme [Sulfitobacter noctilucicola]
MYSAKRIPRFDSPAAWAELLGDYPAAQPLTEGHKADVTIIGAGFAGLSAARRLVQLDTSLRVTVLDALRVGEGSAGRNSGFMIDLPHDLASDDYAGGGDDKALTTLNRQAIAFAKGAVAEYRINPAYADLVGKVNGAATEAGDAHNQSYARHLASLGEPSEMLDAHAMCELTGSSYYRSGLYTPGTLMLQPAGYVQGLAAGLRQAGVQVVEHCAVRGFEKSGSGWRVRTAQGDVRSGHIIVAANGHLESFGIAKARLIQLFLFASITPELSSEEIAALGGAPRWGITPADPMGTTMRRIDTAQGGNRIITRTCAVVRPDMSARPKDLSRAKAVQMKKFADRFPNLAGMEMAQAWAGHLCLTLNGVSVAREIEQGVFSACVQNGLGTARGTLTGIAAAEAVMGHPSAIRDHFEQEAQPKPLPPQPFATWGANAYLRWKERRAGAE